MSDAHKSRPSQKDLFSAIFLPLPMQLQRNKLLFNNAGKEQFSNGYFFNTVEAKLSIQQRHAILSNGFIVCQGIRVTS